MTDTCARCEGKGTITVTDDTDSAVLWCGDCLGSGKAHPEDRKPDADWGEPAPRIPAKD